MENRKKSKYDIPLIVVDTRQGQRKIPMTGKRAVPVLKKEKEVFLNPETMLSYLMQSLKKPLIALKYRFFKKLDEIFEDVEVPWLKIIAVSIIAFMAFKKDIRFNLSFNGTNDALLNETNDRGQLVRNTTFGLAGNPYTPVSAQSLADKKAIAFIKKFSPVAKVEMKKFGIPASVKMAQALIESNAGHSRLATVNNNHFGIKCFSRNCEEGHCTNATDDHHKDFFRKYNSAWESWRSHSELLQNTRYQGLKEYGTNYKKWAHGLKNAGYATDEKYATKLINTIEKYQLYKLDEI